MGFVKSECLKLLIPLLNLACVVSAYLPGGGSRCEDLSSAMCKDVPYNSTVMPNLLNHPTQEEAGKELIQFYPLIKTRCSNALNFFLCTWYFPVCTVLSYPIPPCKELCLKAKDGCEKQLNEFGYLSHPNFDCDKFPHSNAEGLCISYNDEYQSSETAEQTVPDIVPGGDGGSDVEENHVTTVEPNYLDLDLGAISTFPPLQPEQRTTDPTHKSEQFTCAPEVSSYVLSLLQTIHTQLDNWGSRLDQLETQVSTLQDQMAKSERGIEDKIKAVEGRISSKIKDGNRLVASAEKRLRNQIHKISGDVLSVKEGVTGSEEKLKLKLALVQEALKGKIEDTCPSVVSMVDKDQKTDNVGTAIADSVSEWMGIVSEVFQDS